MEVQEQNRYRRSVRFDAACLGFREPYKVICDDIFMFYLVGHQITPADTALANTLGGAVQLFTTRCVLEELKSPEFKRILGAFHSKTLDATSSLLTARCGHNKPRSSEACILDVIWKNNSENFFVATQGSYLQKKLQKIPGVPIIYGLKKALFLEQPSTLQQQFSDIESDADVDTCNASEEEEGHGLEVQNMKKRKKNRNHLLFKRKKAKSLKKKKKPTAESVKANE